MGALAPALSTWIPEDDLLLKNAIEAGASLESLAKGTKNSMGLSTIALNCTEATNLFPHLICFKFFMIELECFMVAISLEKAALSDEYFIKRKLYPNVDFYSGLIYRRNCESEGGGKKMKAKRKLGDSVDRKRDLKRQRVVDSPSSPPEESLCLIMTMKMMKGEH
ncbi:hypothetical protein ES288_D13G205900v1 [Gossypium darwinii]|uniref:Uncharacterized protein n=1 Tax=Gossypium darwinii TaxID=34276 RepID=A0A5D2A2X4_GOSDA|nr:hypothetical protein ES288_D13G205900v1 [Gossypium darwinii]